MRKLIKSILYNRKFNPIFRLLIKPFSYFIPKKLARKLPMLGKISVRLPDGNSLILEDINGEDSISRVLYWKGFKGFEYETTKVFFELSKRSKVTLDIGSNIGYYALLAGIANKEAKVYAFEPVPRVYERLKRNIELNKCSNIKAICAAVTSSNGKIAMYVPKFDLPTSASSSKGYRENVEELEVLAVSLDSFADKEKVEINLMKIDTETTENDVLKGAQNIIQKNRPIMLCEVINEILDSDLKSIEEFLNSIDYVYYLT